MDNAADCISIWGLVRSLFIDNDCALYYQSEIPVMAFDLGVYLKYFLLTNLLEFPFYYLILQDYKKPLKNLKALVTLNLCTHPFVFFVWPRLLHSMDLNYVQYLLSAELMAPTVEFLVLTFFFKYGWKRSLAAAFIANIASWSIGVYLV